MFKFLLLAFFNGALNLYLGMCFASFLHICLFVLTLFFRMEISHTMLCKARGKFFTLLVDWEMLDTASIFISKGSLGRAFTELGPSSDWGLLVPEEDKGLCSKHESFLFTSIFFL